MKRDWAALILAMLFPSIVAYLYFVALAGHAAGGDSNRLVQFTYGVGKVFQFVGPVAFLWHVDRNYFRTLNLRMNGVGWGIAFGCAVAALMMALAREIPDSAMRTAATKIRGKIIEFGVGSPRRFLFLAGFLSVIHSFLEEAYYRWFIFGRLRKLASFGPAATLSSLAFMGHHVFVINEYFGEHFFLAVVPFSLAIAVGGFFWAWLYERNESLVGTWISHLIVDVAIMYIGYRLVFAAQVG